MNEKLRMREVVFIGNFPPRFEFENWAFPLKKWKNQF